MRPGEPVTLNFANADIEAVARTMATITGRNVVVDPRVKGQLNLVTERAVTPAAAFEQFLAALRLQGYTVVETSGLYKVVPEAEGKLQGSSVRVWQQSVLQVDFAQFAHRELRFLCRASPASPFATHDFKAFDAVGAVNGIDRDHLSKIG